MEPNRLEPNRCEPNRNDVQWTRGTARTEPLEPLESLEPWEANASAPSFFRSSVGEIWSPTSKSAWHKELHVPFPLLGLVAQRICKVISWSHQNKL